jgi:hypothetical protein
MGDNGCDCEALPEVPLLECIVKAVVASDNVTLDDFTVAAD